MTFYVNSISFTSPWGVSNGHLSLNLKESLTWNEWIRRRTTTWAEPFHPDEVMKNCYLLNSPDLGAWSRRVDIPAIKRAVEERSIAWLNYVNNSRTEELEEWSKDKALQMRFSAMPNQRPLKLAIQPNIEALQNQDFDQKRRWLAKQKEMETLFQKVPGSATSADLLALINKLGVNRPSQLLKNPNDPDSLRFMADLFNKNPAAMDDVARVNGTEMVKQAVENCFGRLGNIVSELQNGFRRLEAQQAASTAALENMQAAARNPQYVENELEAAIAAINQVRATVAGQVASGGGIDMDSIRQMLSSLVETSTKNYGVIKQIGDHILSLQLLPDKKLIERLDNMLRQVEELVKTRLAFQVPDIPINVDWQPLQDMMDQQSRQFNENMTAIMNEMQSVKQEQVGFLRDGAYNHYAEAQLQELKNIIQSGKTSGISPEALQLVKAELQATLGDLAMVKVETSNQEEIKQLSDVVRAAMALLENASNNVENKAELGAALAKLTEGVAGLDQENRSGLRHMAETINGIIGQIVTMGQEARARDAVIGQQMETVSQQIKDQSQQLGMFLNSSKEMFSAIIQLAIEKSTNYLSTHIDRQSQALTEAISKAAERHQLVPITITPVPMETGDAQRLLNSDFASKLAEIRREGAKGNVYEPYRGSQTRAMLGGLLAILYDADRDLLSNQEFMNDVGVFNPQDWKDLEDLWNQSGEVYQAFVKTMVEKIMNWSQEDQKWIFENLGEKAYQAIISVFAARQIDQQVPLNLQSTVISGLCIIADVLARNTKIKPNLVMKVAPRGAPGEIIMVNSNQEEYYMEADRARRALFLVREHGDPVTMEDGARVDSSGNYLLPLLQFFRFIRQDLLDSPTTTGGHSADPLPCVNTPDPALVQDLLNLNPLTPIWDQNIAACAAYMRYEDPNGKLQPAVALERLAYMVNNMVKFFNRTIPSNLKEQIERADPPDSANELLKITSGGFNKLLIERVPDDPRGMKTMFTAILGSMPYYGLDEYIRKMPANEPIGSERSVYQHWAMPLRQMRNAALAWTFLTNWIWWGWNYQSHQEIPEAFYVDFYPILGLLASSQEAMQAFEEANNFSEEAPADLGDKARHVMERRLLSMNNLAARTAIHQALTTFTGQPNFNPSGQHLQTQPGVSVFRRPDA